VPSGYTAGYGLADGQHRGARPLHRYLLIAADDSDLEIDNAALLRRLAAALGA
jgi:hypothetical protein